MVPDPSNPTDIANASPSPADWVDRYWNVPVGDTTVSINKYMIGIHNADAGATKRNLVMQEAAKRKLAVDKKAFNRASMGKVSPDDCEHILNLALDTGKATEGTIQAWADQSLGVDCTGFVVAYYSELSRISLDKYSGGASCPFLVGAAKKGKPPGLPSALIWDFDDIRTGDMVVWMTDKMLETRKPGHIALVSYANVVPDAVLIAHSNGANDGSGHFGPKHGRLGWDGVKTGGNGKYIQVDGTGKVIVVRPPAWIP
ncbi:MAG: hypothetical protein J0I42_23135 [Bosea sp.]|uniref:hypothetical protein n=1 Tax=Bosea sp. (in: a-proteobacteria) TaxID=1871050 RepID=UPI001ACB69AC|nr:hypothetical protein [Bosea sp. (in: a-proteobacteria)]MBN9454847.1 hypothetical protein [Bosea sp. (in: a-proteobacteria)]